MQFDPNMSYPIRKINSFDQGANKIIELLQTTNMTMEEIAKECNKSATTVRRINKGETHYNKNLTYPVRH